MLECMVAVNLLRNENGTRFLIILGSAAVTQGAIQAR